MKKLGGHRFDSEIYKSANITHCEHHIHRCKQANRRAVQPKRYEVRHTQQRVWQRGFDNQSRNVHIDVRSPFPKSRPDAAGEEEDARADEYGYEKVEGDDERGVRKRESPRCARQETSVGLNGTDIQSQDSEGDSGKIKDEWEGDHPFIAPGNVTAIKLLAAGQ